MHYLNNIYFAEHWLLMLIVFAFIFLVTSYIINDKFLFKKSLFLFSSLSIFSFIIYLFFPSIASPSLSKEISTISEKAIHKAPGFLSTIINYFIDLLSKGFRR